MATWLNGLGFLKVQPNYYWSSSTFAISTDYAWVVGMSLGYVYYYYKGGAPCMQWSSRRGSGTGLFQFLESIAIF
jgi:hypothetical protein